MIIVFWLLIALLTLVAVAMVIYPLLKQQGKKQVEQQQLNKQIYRQELAALEQKKKHQSITDNEYQQSKTMLDKKLLANVEMDSVTASSAFKPARWLSVVMLLAIPLMALTLYFHWGASQKLERYWVLKREAKAVKAEMAKLKNPQQLITELRLHLQQAPNSAKGWYLLGQLYFGEERYLKAEQALIRAYQLQPQNNQYAVAYVQAVFFRHQRRLTAQTETILKTVIKRTPDFAPAINLLAINAYLEKRYQVVVNYWQMMLPLFSPESRDGKTLLKMIAMAQKHIAKLNKGSPAPSVQVTIVLLPALHKLVKSSDSVYVFIQATKGSSMPLAVARKTVADLPMTLTLRTLQAMLLGHELHIGEKVKITARIAKVAGVMAKSGDLQSVTKVLTLRRHNIVSLQINDIVR